MTWNLISGIIKTCNHRHEKKQLLRFASLSCKTCDRVFGYEAIRRGSDISPFEEIWSDSDDAMTHHFPIIRLVECSSCSCRWTLRYNSEGVDFGPEFAITPEEE